MPERVLKRRDRAVALRYNADVPAPFVVAKAEGRMAETMLKMAAECGIPVVSDKGCADLLFPLDLGTCVPPGLYEVLAKVFAWIQAAEEP